MKSALWISYDFGIHGDYEGIYAWLDEHDAIECGDSVAFIHYDHADDLIDDLRADLDHSVEITKKTRIYVIWKEPETRKIKGRFVFGNRKAAPWTGYAVTEEVMEDEEI